MGNNKLKNWIYGGIVVVVLGFLFGWPIVTDPNRPIVKAWNDAGLDCLGGHTNLIQHIHQSLVITIDGEEETIMGEVGIVPGCMSEIHVHKGEPNKLHVETVSPDKTLTLDQFFVVYGRPIIREGYSLEARVNGQMVTEPERLILADNQEITLVYKSK